MAKRGAAKRAKKPAAPKKQIAKKSETSSSSSPSSPSSSSTRLIVLDDESSAESISVTPTSGSNSPSAASSSAATNTVVKVDDAAVEPFRPSYSFYHDIRSEASHAAYEQASVEMDTVVSSLLTHLSRSLRSGQLGARIEEEFEAQSSMMLSYEAVRAMLTGRW